MRPIRFLSVLIALSAGLPLPSAFSQTPQNAKEFLTRLKDEGGGSGGAGNGGNNLIADYYRQALIGLQYLKLTKLLDDDSLSRIHEAIKNSKAYPVGFQLCALDSDHSCTDDEALASKNYPATRTILVDARRLPRRFATMTLIEQRRHTLHEFAGLAGIELSNHSFTALIDAPSLYDNFDNKDEKREYFAILGSLFQSLPSSLPAEYAGTWRKRTSLMRNRHRSVQGSTDLIPGDAYAIQIENSLKVVTWNYYYRVTANAWGYNHTFHESCKIGEMGLECGATNHRPWQKVLRRHERKYPEMFTPLELKHRAEVSPLSCKPWTETELICRHFYYHWLPYSPIQTLLWTHEYAIFTKITDSTEIFRAPPEPSRSVFKDEHGN